MILPRQPDCNGLWSREIEQHHIRACLHSFNDNFTTIRRDIEILNVEFGSEVGQLPVRTCLKIDEPEILMLNLPSQQHK